MHHISAAHVDDTYDKTTYVLQKQISVDEGQPWWTAVKFTETKKRLKHKSTLVEEGLMGDINVD